MVARQLVRLSDGSVRTYDDAGRLRHTPESSHSHWHLLDFQRYELRTLEGDLVVRDRKSGFCLADHDGLARRRVAMFSEEIDYTNNAASLRIRLSWSGGVPHVETLRTRQASADC